MKNFARKAGKHLKSNAVKYVVIVTATGLVVVTYTMSLTVNDMENFLREKGLFEEWQNQEIA